MCGSSCHWDILLAGALNCAPGDEEARGEAGEDVGQSTEQLSSCSTPKQSQQQDQRSQISTVALIIYHMLEILEYIHMGQGHTKLP